MKNFVRILSGICFFCIGVFLCVSCLSYHTSDESFNTASSFPVQNWLGFYGAVSADILIQLFGRYALLIPISACVFGLFLLLRKRWLFFRFVMFLMGLLGAAWLSGGSAVPVDGTWLNSGTGGFIGFYLRQWIDVDLGMYQYIAWGLVVICFIFSLAVPVRLICRWSSKKVSQTVSSVHLPQIDLKKVVMPLNLKRQERIESPFVETNVVEETSDLEQITELTQPNKTSFFSRLKKDNSSKVNERVEPVFDFGEVLEKQNNDVNDEHPSSQKESLFKKMTKKSVEKSETRQKSIKKDKGTQMPTAGQDKDSLELPSSALLDEVKGSTAQVLSKDAMEKISRDLERVLAQFGVKGSVIGFHPGPVVTLYEFLPADGIKAARVISLADDVAMKMSVVSVRMAVIPGTCYIGIEMPNKQRETVYIREMIENINFQTNSGALPLILGKDIGGTPVFADLAKMPHLLVAGTTGSGKSVGINTMVLSLLYRFTPAECRMIMVDPKMVELSVYNRIPHLLTPVVTEPEKAVVALKWAVREMEDRYRSMSQLGVRNISGYNQKLVQAAKEGRVLTRRVQTGFDPETGRPIIEEQQFDLTPIPYIVIIVDEMADLMGRCGKEVDPLIQRLAQMARAVGIHLILATQRPSVDVITGTIKSNFPSRMSFQVQNKIDSRTILSEPGAERLLGKGDMLFMPAGSSPQRVHGPFVSDDEVERVVHHWELQAEPEYVEAVTQDVDGGSIGTSGNVGDVSGVTESGDLYDKAVAIVLRDKKPTTSYIQRQLRIGYNKAADLIDRMEAEGIVSKPNIAGKREIIVPTDNA